ncbi:hypothetical protein KAU88_05700 [Candidatus Bathyarchaeota archaeon]|nr:hypothetical protein [Candidatus Bathyarchaeota archaeon]
MPKIWKRCFVIMPFSQTSKEHTEEYWTRHFKSFLKPLIEESREVKAYRSEPLRGDVLKQIITELVISPIVVADLTDRNPNVFWELGVRQSFKHGTITVAEIGTEIPFDMTVKGVLFYYPKNHIKNAEFSKRFKTAVGDCLSHPDTPDSHVLETISGRGTLYQILRRGEALRRVEGLIIETEWNESVINSLYEVIKEKGRIPTWRLQSCSLELLMTHRYLEEDPIFYKFARKWYTWICTTNEQLTAIEVAEESSKKWLQKSHTKKNLKEHCSTFKKEVIKIREKLASSF